MCLILFKNYASIIKDMGVITSEHTTPWMYCKSIWIKVSECKMLWNQNVNRKWSDWKSLNNHSQTKQKIECSPNKCCKLLAITSKFTCTVSSHFDISDLTTYFLSGGVNTFRRDFLLFVKYVELKCRWSERVFSSKRPVNFFFLGNWNFHISLSRHHINFHWMDFLFLKCQHQVIPGLEGGGREEATNLAFFIRFLPNIMRWIGINTKNDHHCIRNCIQYSTDIEKIVGTLDKSDQRWLK